MTLVFNQMHKGSLSNILRTREYEPFINLIYFVKSLYRHVYSTFKKPHYLDYLCRLLVYTTSFFKSLMKNCTANAPSRFYKVLSATFLEAALTIQTLNKSWCELESEVFIYDFHDCKYRSVALWLEETKIVLKVIFYYCSDEKFYSMYNLYE